MENQKPNQQPISSPALRPPSGTVQERQDLTSKSQQMSNETAITAMATKSRAEIEAAYVMAKKFPRNEEDVRIKVLKTCRIPSFAEKAKYKKPQGKIKNERGQWVQNYIVGPSVRLAEEMYRQWGHLDIEVTILYEDVNRRMVQVRAIDMETGATGRQQFLVDKIVERKNAYGRVVVEERINSNNERIFIVQATEDEVMQKQNATASKIRRNLILQLIPAYLLSDAIEAVDETVVNAIKEDPEKAKKTVADSYAKLGVMPSNIEEYLGHPLAQLRPDEIADLKAIYSSIMDGETTWAQVLENKDAEEKAQPEKASFEDALKPGDESTHTEVDAPVGKTKRDEQIAEIKACAKKIWPKSVKERSDWLMANYGKAQPEELSDNDVNSALSTLLDLTLAG